MQKYKPDEEKQNGDEKNKYEYFDFSPTQILVKMYRWCTCSGGRWDFVNQYFEHK